MTLSVGPMADQITLSKSIRQDRVSNAANLMITITLFAAGSVAKLGKLIKGGIKMSDSKDFDLCPYAIRKMQRICIGVDMNSLDCKTCIFNFYNSKEGESNESKAV